MNRLVPLLRASGTDWLSLAWERDTECGHRIKANKVMERSIMAVKHCLCPALTLKVPLLPNISAVSAIYTFFPLSWQQLSFSK